MADNAIVLGGLQGFSDLANSANTLALRATGRAGFYAHIQSMGLPYSAGPDTLPGIAQVFQNSGAYVAELDYTDNVASQAAYFGSSLTGSFAQFGAMPDEALINMFSSDDVNSLAQTNWKTYIDDARAAGIQRLEPIFSPNGDTSTSQIYDLNSFLDPVYNNVRAAALYGGGLALDLPPAYLYDLTGSSPALGAKYLAFVEQEINWANANGIRSTVIISPYSSGVGFLDYTQDLVQRLQADGAVPQQYIVENYAATASPMEQYNYVGSDQNTNNLAGVALWLAQNAETTPMAGQSSATSVPTGASTSLDPTTVTPPTEASSVSITAAPAIGEGSDAIILDLSGVPAGGTVLAQVSIDGMLLGAPVTVTASTAANAVERFTFYGDYGSGQHLVSVSLATLDAPSGLSLTLAGLSYDGRAYSDAATLTNPTAATFVVGSASAALSINPSVLSASYTDAAGFVTPVTGPTIGSGSDTIVLSVAEDAFQGDAQFTIDVDGRQVGGTQTVTAPNASGQWETFTVDAALAAGQHTITLNFLNPTGTGAFVNARNLYLTGVTLDGVAYNDQATMLTTQPVSFVIGTALAANSAVTLTDGQSLTTPTGTSTTVTMTSGAESVISYGADTINGGSGNEIVVTSGTAVFNAGSATATVTLNGPAATVHGGTGSLTVQAAVGNDVITTLNGTSNTISLGSGSNVVNSGGADSVNGTQGNQSVSLSGSTGTLSTGFGTTAVTLGGGAYEVSSFGTDTIHAGSGSATILGGFSPNDPTQDVFGGSGTLLFGAGDGAATVWGGTGSDTLYGGAAGGLLIGGNGGHNIIFAGTGTVTISGGGNNQLFGGPSVAGTAAGYDQLVGGSGSDVIYAVQGDSVSGGTGPDTIYGASSGGSTVAGGSGHAIMYGEGDGDVFFAGGSLGQMIIGGAGRETLSGGGSTGNNTLVGGSGSDIIVAGQGNDLIQIGSGLASIFGGVGNDTIQGGAGQATIQTGSGNSTVYGGTGSVTVFGGGGGVLIGGNAGYNNLIAGSGNVTLAGGGMNAQFGGTAVAGSVVGHDVLTGGPGNTVIYAVAGDSVFGGSGSDTIYGASSGGSIVAGGTGRETMYGEGDGDIFFAGGSLGQMIIGGAGRETLSGGASTGNNVIQAGSGNDQLYGGKGNDKITTGSGNSSVFGGSGTDTIIGGSGAATVNLGAGASVVGGSGSMTLFGSSGSDTIAAGAGTLNSALGNGNDFIAFGSGSSTVYGGTGIDAYSITAVANTSRVETIGSYNVAVDSFALKGGLSVTLDRVINGSANVVLSDGSQLRFLGITNTTSLTFTQS